MDFHGYNDIYKSNSVVLKSFWILTIVAATVTTISYSVVTIIRYVNNPSSVSIANIPLSSQSLPDVQICTQQIFNVTKLRNRGYSQPTIDYLFKYMSLYSYGQTKTADFVGLITTLSNTTIADSLGLTSSYTIEDLVMDNGLECNELLLSCNIATKHFNCCDHVRDVVSSCYGKCFVLGNLGEIEFQIWPGTTGGLFILIDADPQSSGSFNVSLPGNTGIGVNIYVGDHIPIASQDVSAIQINKANYVALEETRFSRLSSSGCGMIPSSDCGSLCYSLALNTTINCTQLGYWKIHGIPVCDPISIAHLWSSFMGSAMDLYKKCSNDKCTYSSCKEKRQKVSLSYADRDMQRVRKVNGVNDNSTLSELFIYFNTLGYTELVEFQSVTADSVISSIGGNMGLFMGASIITVIQAIILLVERFRLYLRQRKIHRSSVEDPQQHTCPNSLRRFSAPNMGCKVGPPDKNLLYGGIYKRPKNGIFN